MKNESYGFNVYDWMNSRDVADYNRKIGHVFNVMETAYLISENHSRTLAEKWEAYRWIMEHMPDMPVTRRNNCGPYDSFHKALKQHMTLVEVVLEECRRPSPESIYTYRIYYDPMKTGEYYDHCTDCGRDRSFWDSDTCFRSWEECLDEVRREVSKDDDGSIRHFDVIKKSIYGARQEQKLVSIEIDRDLNIRGIADHMNLDLSDEEVDLLDLFEAIWVDVPVPFRRGDIVYADETEYGCRPRPFCLWNTANQDNRIGHDGISYLEKKKKSADSMDMTADGCWIDHEIRGSIYWECMHAYHNLEYYREPLKGYDRILKVIERFYSDMRAEEAQSRYDISHVLVAYRYILLEEECREMENKYGFELKVIGVMPDATNGEGRTEE